MQKKFDTFLEEFRRRTNINPTGISLDRCLSVYTAVRNMENAGKRLKYTFQNIGLAVEALPTDMRCAHGTLKNDSIVEAFVNYIVETMSGSGEKRRLMDENRHLREEIKRLNLELETNILDAMEVEDLKVQLELSMATTERYKELFNQANDKLHKLNDYSLDTSQTKPSQENPALLDDGTYVDTSTGEIRSNTSF